MHQKLLLALGSIVIIILAVSSLVFSFDHPTSPTTTSSVNPCRLLTPSEEDYLAWNGVGREIPGLNQSSPPWDYQSIYDHIQEGWGNLCQSSAFVTAVQAHGAASFSVGGGFINSENPQASQAGVAIVWTQTSSTTCTQYIE